MDTSKARTRGRAWADKTLGRITTPTSWLLPKQSSSIAPVDIWTNSDQDPVPSERQTWTAWTFIMYWYSDLVTVSTWSTASSIMTTGLSATDAVLIVLVAAICNCIPTVLNGAIGADLHIAFPIVVRASHGYWFSYFCIVTRGILAMFWFGVQTAQGGACMKQILIALWPSFSTLPNHMPQSAGLATNGFIAYFLYWLLQFPFLLIPTHKLHYLFIMKTALVTPMALVTVLWITIRAGGQGDFFSVPGTVHGRTRAWLWLANLTSVTGGYTTLTVNIPDFSRFSKTSGAQVWQLPFIPLFKVICGLFGIIAASASKQLYGKTYWSPLDIIGQWQSTPGGRAAAFFSASIWLISQIGVNISGNSISFANDITFLLPRYINIRRGVVILSFLGGWALCPWIIIASASSFLNFMSAYAIFMAPMAAIMCCDYWIIKRRRYDVPALYDPRGIYSYGRYGINWRALAVTLVTIVPMLPALAQKVAPQTIHIAHNLVNLFSFNWLYGFFLSFVMYYGLNYVFPHHQTLLDYTVSGYPNNGVSQSVSMASENQVQEVSKLPDMTQKVVGVQESKELWNSSH